MTSPPRHRVMFYVQHLLGIGHVYRALRIIDDLAASGLAVDLVLGGRPFKLPPTPATVHQLPAVASGEGGFTDLVDEAGRPVDKTFKADRAARLVALYRSLRPDVLILEAYPFGRRQMRFELVPLLAAARESTPRPLVAASLRDILQRNRKAGRDAESVAAVAESFDLVLVHGEAAIARLEAAIPEAAAIAGKVRYTGLVGPRLPREGDVPAYGVVVSAGGGAVGSGLLTAALRAKPLTRLSSEPWCIITGPNMAPETAERIAILADPGCRIERFVPALPALLARARLSISQCGYNTVADLLAAGCRSVVVPFAEGGETEQAERARQLEAAGLAVAVAEASLTPQRLATAVERCLDRPAPAPRAMTGGVETARILHAELGRRAGAR